MDIDLFMYAEEVARRLAARGERWLQRRCMNAHGGDDVALGRALSTSSGCSSCEGQLRIWSEQAPGISGPLSDRELVARWGEVKPRRS